MCRAYKWTCSWGYKNPCFDRHRHYYCASVQCTVMHSVHPVHWYRPNEAPDSRQDLVSGVHAEHKHCLKSCIGLNKVSQQKGVHWPSLCSIALMLWPSFVLPVGSIYDERLDVRHTGMSPSEKRLYCFLSVSQRLSLQRFFWKSTSITADCW